MDFSEFAHIQLGELETVKGCLTKSIKEAVPIMREFCEKHSLSWDQCKRLTAMVKRLCEA